MQDPDRPRINCEVDPVAVRISAVEQLAYFHSTLRELAEYRTASRHFAQRGDRALHAIHPLGAANRSYLNELAKERLKVLFGARAKLNAKCHTSPAGARRLLPRAAPHRTEEHTSGP